VCRIAYGLVGCGLAAATLQFAASTRAVGEPIPEPDAVYYGHVFQNGALQTGLTVSLQVGDSVLDQYTISSSGAAATFYVLRARLFSTVTGDPRPQGGAFIGDTVSIFLASESTPRQQFQVHDRGEIVQVDISTDGTPIPSLSPTPVPTMPPVTATATATGSALITPSASPIGTMKGTVTTSPKGSITPSPTPTATPIPNTTPQGKSSLDEPIDAAATTIPVADPSAFPNSGVVQIDDELIYFSGKSIMPAAVSAAADSATADAPDAGVLTGVIRGYGGTTAAPHAVGAQVLFTPVSACIGDCGNQHAVGISNLITMVNIALGTDASSKCLAGDTNHDSAISISEIIQAVNNALGGCQ
jgi:hypothetical protein